MPPFPRPSDRTDASVPTDESVPHLTSVARRGKIGAPEPIAALNRVKIRELSRPWTEREPLVDVRTYCPDVVLSEWLCPYLRVRAADMLNQAQASLPAGYRLKVGTCLRTLSMQSHGWDNYFARMKEEHPQWPYSALRRATNKFFAPYDQPAPPGHCTGGAIDVGLLDPEGNSLDMTAPTKGWEAAYTWSDKIGPEAKANRMRMVEAMLGAGFSNCRDEYWHYSWGDSAWAVRVGERECPYGWAHPPAALETDFPGASASDLQIETHRNYDGRALSAAGAVAFSPEYLNTRPPETPHFAVGLYWAKEVPVTLQLKPPPGFGSDLTLYSGRVGEEWRPISTVDRHNEILMIRITPDRDRLILTTAPIAAPEKSQ